MNIQNTFFLIELGKKRENQVLLISDLQSTKDIKTQFIITESQKKLDYYEGIFSGLTSEGIIKYNSSIFNETILNLLPEDWTKEDINQ